MGRFFESPKDDEYYDSIKDQARDSLVQGDFQGADKLYHDAGNVMKEAIQVNCEGRTDMRSVKIAYSEELARIYSNLSLVSFKRQQYEKALIHAEQAILLYPSWSKLDCRRALALEALHKLDDALLAIFNAQMKTKTEKSGKGAKQVKRESLKKEQLEYQSIKQRIEAALESTTATKMENIKNTTKNLNNLQGAIFVEQGLMNKTYEYLTLQDVSQLHQTCKAYSTHSEQGIRIAMTNPLRNSCLDCSMDSTTRSQIEQLLLAFCYQQLDERSRYEALGELATAIHQLLSPNDPDDHSSYLVSRLGGDETTFAETTAAAAAAENVENTRPTCVIEDLLKMGMNELSYNVILPIANHEDTFYNVPFFFEPPTCQKFCIAKFLLQEEGGLSAAILSQIIAYMNLSITDKDSRNTTLLKMVRYGVDDCILPYMDWKGDFDMSDNNNEDHANYVCLFQSSIDFLRLFVQVGKNYWKVNGYLNGKHPIARIQKSFCDFYSIHFPSEWPCIFGPTVDVFPNQDAVEASMREDSTLFLCWKTLILKSLNWFDEEDDLEELGEQYMFVTKHITMRMAKKDSRAYEYLDDDSLRCPLNFPLGFSTFLIQQVFKYKSTTIMSKYLNDEKDIAQFIGDFYKMIMLHEMSYPQLQSEDGRTVFG